MPMMQVWIMRMPMHQPDMLVPMQMWLPRRVRWRVLVLVMRVMNVPVFVSHRFADVFMLIEASPELEQTSHEPRVNGAEQ
jgi:hypothetical protein